MDAQSLIADDLEPPAVPRGGEDARWPAAVALDKHLRHFLTGAGGLGDGVGAERQLIRNALRDLSERAVFGEEVVAEGEAHY